MFHIKLNDLNSFSPKYFTDFETLLDITDRGEIEKLFGSAKHKFS